ncbi:PAS domain S-box protein [Hwanghaeella grinnelliae]|uniref:Sensory/regulatory protein RpfC n=1 Tax=Hwanghaeella grinnelliae TaxID=2500179 RepID=A0A3S2ZAA4_9PROT|nr:MHYT domain-containing protein [Hwanghaeella grinnelliae]RVU39155.1 PAS domain S-box protein [Hwanghaeella grinnelliae]
MDFTVFLDRFFVPVGSDVLLASELYKGEYNAFLVILSALIAISCAYIALSAVGRSRKASSLLVHAGWMGVASITMGIGVWSMHFVGMLSFELPCAVEYDSVLTFVSMLPSIIASMIALSIIRLRRVTTLPLRLFGGVLMASGIAAMHYTGMAAMRMDAMLYYDGARVTLSVLLAVSLACLSLSLPSFFLGRTGTKVLAVLNRRGIVPVRAVAGMSAVGLGLAVTGMHYTAMWAAYFVPWPGGVAAHHSWEPGILALWIVLAVVLLSTAVIAIVFASKQRMLADELKAQVALRSRVEAAVEEQRGRLQAIIDNVVDGIITINASGTIQHWSPAAQALFGYTDEEVTGQNVNMLMAEPFLDEDDDSSNGLHLRERRQVVGVGREAVGLRKDGSTFPLDLSIGYGEVNGRPFYTGVVRDLTQRKKELAILEEARDRAQQAVKAKSEFLANMSHEIRTPMNGVLGFLGLALNEKSLSPEVRSYLNTAEKSANNLLVIIDDILDFSRLESGRIRLESVSFDLRNLVSETVHGLSTLADDRSLTVTVRVAEDAPVLVKGDPMRIRQILINLISNAIKFTHEGGVSVDVSRFSAESDQILFTVADTGIGMSPETLERVLQPFEQADSATHRLYGGTGLGTTISLQLAHLQGGDLWAESEEGKGSTFFFTALLPESSELDVASTPALNAELSEVDGLREPDPGMDDLFGGGPIEPRPEKALGADRETLRKMFEDLYKALDEDNPEPVEHVLDEMSDVLDRRFVTQMRKSVSQFDFGLAREKADLMMADLHLR